MNPDTAPAAPETAAPAAAPEAVPAPSPETPQTNMLGVTPPDPAAPPQEPQEIPSKPEWCPEKYWRNDKVDVEAMAKGVHGLEQLLGKKSKAIVPPNEKSTPEEVAEFRKAIGVPNTPDEYQTKPDALPEGMTWDDNLDKSFRQLAHKHNIPSAAVKEFIAFDLQRQQAMQAAQAHMLEQQVQSGIATLKQTYGTELDAKIEQAKLVAASAGIPVTDPMWLSPNAVKLALWARDRMSDDKIIDPGANTMSSAAARATDIQTNPQNPLYKRYQEGDAETVDLVRRLRSQR